MKLIKAIKLHRKLRIRQEILFHACILWSQEQWITGYKPFPDLNEFSSINHAVIKIENKLPNIYFFLSDILGYSDDLRYQDNT